MAGQVSLALLYGCGIEAGYRTASACSQTLMCDGLVFSTRRLRPDPAQCRQPWIGVSCIAARVGALLVPSDRWDAATSVPFTPPETPWQDPCTVFVTVTFLWSTVSNKESGPEISPDDIITAHVIAFYHRRRSMDTYRINTWIESTPLVQCNPPPYAEAH